VGTGLQQRPFTRELSLLFAVFAVFAVFTGNLQRVAASLPQKSWNLGHEMTEEQRETTLRFCRLLA
jgi:hypothetical protein